MRVKKTDIKSWLCAALAVVLLGLAVYGFHEKQKTEYPVICLGDSIVGNVRDHTSLTALLEEQLGKAVFNGGFGGTTLSLQNREERPAAPADCLTGTELIKALAYEDFYVQNAGVAACSALEYFPDSVKALQKIDMDKTQVLVIEHGVNDYLTGTPLDNPQDPYDPYTFGGALRNSLSLLKEKYPKLKVILATPTYCWFPQEQTDCEKKDRGQGILEDYVNLELAIAEEYQVEVVDNYHGVFGNVKEPESWKQYTTDGIHLNEAGRRLVAGRIAEVINGE